MSRSYQVNGTNMRSSTEEVGPLRIDKYICQVRTGRRHQVVFEVPNV